ncbi:MFS general substrate transporter [Cristinia sonorae]|uniref:MFS general substrate transporter n=1 Tax=Cristinia sonorae TaxID=1940300 RepID=A0A8K0XT26_9AGAR|nr:MFS general substrate transporter [Cristinia sonorae]
MTFSSRAELGGGGEERCLVDSPRPKIKLPKVQLAVLLVAYFTQPVACTVIYPFIAKLIAELDLVHGDTSKIGYYSGLFDALPLLSEALAIMYWTRLGEHYGRKRVLLCGALGVAFSLTSFGLSKTLPALIISRALQGALNANSGTIKTMIGEIAEGDEIALARAFSFVPIVWATGSTLAPLVGGALQHPAERFPRWFAAWIWSEYPYLLPCIVAAGVPMVAFISVLVFLKQNDSAPKVTETKRKPSYGSTCSGELQTPSRSHRCLEETASVNATSAISNSFVWTRTLIVTFLNYAILVVLTSSFYALISVFLATPVASGGLGFEPSAIGISMALMGLFHGIFQACFFVSIHRRVDPKRLFTMSMVAFGPLYGMMPLMSWVARRRGVGWEIGGLVFLQSVLFMLSFMGYCCMYIFVTRAAPNRESLARTNGLSQIVYSICGALGPTLATILFALTKEHNILGGNFVYILMAALSVCGVFVSNLLPARETS